LRVLVIHPPVSVARDFIDYPYFSDLGAVQLAAVLRAGLPDGTACEVTLVDAYALPGASLAWRDDGRAHLGAPVDDVLAQARAGTRFDAVVVAYTPFHRPPTRCDVLGPLLTGLSGLGPIVLADAYQSGQHYVDVPSESILAAYPEAIAHVKYEAEVTLPALLSKLNSGESIAGGHRGAQVPKLDSLPFPAWDLVDLDWHDAFRHRVVTNLGRGAWPFPIDGRTLPLVTSRGCPFTCVHCSSNPDRLPGEAKTQRRYSAERLSAYLAQLVRVHGADRLEVLDELLNVNERHFDGFLAEIVRLDTRFDVPNGMRADYLEPRHFAAMKGRVTTVSVSAESGVQSVVDRVVKKKLDLKQIVAAAENAHGAGVPLLIHFIIGLPGETAEEINGTFSFAMDLFDRFGAWPAVQFATPLPGTPLAQGRTLPVVADWGPHFQTAPSQPDAVVDAATLQKFKWTLDNRLSASAEPQKVIVNVTYECNNHCTFCATGTRTGIHGHPKRQREHLTKYRNLGVKLVDFDGGEPTLNPELIPLVKYARQIGYERVNVTTNGRTSFYEPYAEKLVNSGLTSLLFSIHGPDAQTHAQQVGVAEAFEQSVGGIRNCLKHAPKGVELGMNITLTKGNYQKLDQVAQLALDVGLAWLNVQFLTPFGRATSWVCPPTEDAARITMGVIDRYRDRMKFQVINLPFCFMPGYEQYLMGDVFKLGRHMVFVNNEDVNLAQYLAERRTRKPVCTTCPHAVFCGGFYELEKVPEPPWIVTEADLERPVPELPVSAAVRSGVVSLGVRRG